MKLIFEERYDRKEINTTHKIIQTLLYWDSEKYSVEFFVSKEFLVVKTYRKED